MATIWLCAALLRRHLTQVVKTALLLFIVSFLWLQLRIVSYKPDFFYRNVRYGELDSTFFANFSAIINSVNHTMPSSLYELKKIIQEINKEQKVLNIHKFGPLLYKDVVIVIQVHNRGQYLYALIESLRQAEGIGQTLLIFSHDLFDPEINALVQQIDFCKVMQIFYPHSIQLYPHEFPGEDPNDCPRNLNKEQALKTNCNNAKHPDLYGHYREAKFTQTKHHWWWKINHVMDVLFIMRNHSGPVLLLEEDHYVASDFLAMLNLMDSEQKQRCQHCNILCLGTYVKSFNYGALSKQVEIVKWLSSKHNMGMILNRSLWNKIRKCAKAFCTFDDYNWDWSLQHISTACLPTHLTAMVAMAPRVFHIGECGVHHRGKDCSSDRVVQKVVRILSSAKQYLFPSSLSIRQGMRRPYKPQKGNGGWGDNRDHRLCLSQVVNSSSIIPKR